MDYMFSRAQTISQHEVLCYSNCDIILMSDFGRALERARTSHTEFLMVGRRWDTDVVGAIDFSKANWESELRQRALATNCQRNAWYIDYFAFSRGLFGADFPELVVGRIYWDNWTIWKALDSNKAVLDASQAVLAIHQNHDYRHHPKGKEGVWGDREARRNYVVAGGFPHLRTIANATYRITNSGVEHNPWHHFPYWLEVVKHFLSRGTEVTLHRWRNTVWHPLLNLTRPLRIRLGLRANRLRSRPRTGE
jgi:hypothetical protein